MMVGKDKIEKLAKGVFTKFPKKRIHMTFISYRTSVTKFSGNDVNHHVDEVNQKVYVTLALGKRLGLVSTNQVSHRILNDIVAQAETIARQQKETPGFTGFIKTKHSNYEKTAAFHTRTGNLSPHKRIEIAKFLIDSAKAAKNQAFGIVANGFLEVGVVNSAGTDAYSRISFTHSSIVLKKDYKTIYGEVTSSLAENLKYERMIQRLIETLNSTGVEKTSIKKGRYKVIIAPEAMFDIIKLLSKGFRANSYHEDQSFLKHKLGEKVFSKALNIYDDPSCEDLFPFPFDMEGTIKKPLKIIENGILKNVLYDTITAKRFNAKPTGHGCIMPLPGGMPYHLIMQPGETQLDEILKKHNKIIFINKFQDLHFTDYSKGNISGITRNFSVIYDNGKEKEILTPMIFNGNIIEMFNNIVDISKESEVVGKPLGIDVIFPKVSKLPYTVIKDVLLIPFV